MVRSKVNSRLALLGGRASVVESEWLFLPVGEGTPQPFERTESKMAKPDGADDEDHQPDEQDHSVELIALEFAEKSEAIPFEDGGADYRGEDVVGKNHLAYRGQSLGGEAQSAEFDQRKDNGDVAQGGAPDFVGNPIVFQGGGCDVRPSGRVRRFYFAEFSGLSRMNFWMRLPVSTSPV